MFFLGVAITQTIHKCQSRLINFKRKLASHRVCPVCGQSEVCVSLCNQKPAGHHTSPKTKLKPNQTNHPSGAPWTISCWVNQMLAGYFFLFWKIAFNC